MNKPEPTKAHKPESPTGQDETTDQADPSTVGYDATVSPPTPSFGDYELITEIARGGMGVVYKARQKSLNRIVALKMIKSGEFANQEQVDRFYKEAEAAANLDHPGIVPVHEVGEVDGQHFFTMGFVDGESLADRLRLGPLPPKEAARYAKSIAEAVAYAHSRGVIHRDLKPGNVLITEEGTLRITDFGLAKRIEEDSELTSTGQVLGTPSYMPPEQAEGKLSEIGPAADIYAIGGTLYCILTGRPPFQAANLIETLYQVLEVEPLSLSSLNRSVPQDLETLCLKCLEKKPSSRYPTAEELVGELNRFLNGEPIVARPIGRAERAVRWSKRKPVAAGFLASLIVVAVGGVTLSSMLILTSRQRAIARVDALLNASPANIPLVLEELDREAGIVDSRLRELDSQELLSPQQIRVSMALLPYDTSQVQKLKQRLHDCTYDELAVALDRLKKYGGVTIISGLWTEFRTDQPTTNTKFRTGLALASMAPKSEQWTSDDYKFLVKSMLAENTLYQPAIRHALSPMAAKLVSAMKSEYENSEPGTLADESSANAIVEFAANDSEILSELSALSSPNQHSVVFPVLARLAVSDKSIVNKLVDITRLHPKPGDNEPTRVKLGKRRAGAAINLVRLEKPDEALEALCVREDPESLTQFVHGCKSRGITVEELLDLLNRATSASERYGILLALGEFGVTDIQEGIRSAWVDYVKKRFATDPSSGIHGASGWLLRRWGLTEEARAIEEREVPYSSDREWFTMKINLAGPAGFEKYSYFTFVVFRAGAYQIGSPGYEPDRGTDETVHTVEFSQDFALLDREVSRGEYESFRRHLNISQHSPSSDSSMVAPNWYDSVRFCRWLTTQRGIVEQCYSDPSTVETSELDRDPAAERMPRNWSVDLSKRGFRLPTESEWEVACRVGMLSRYGFGSDESHLVHYGWYLANSGRHAHVGRVLRPNLRGLFDMHGNVYEWCHDWYGSYESITKTDSVGGGPDKYRVGRGSGWDFTAAGCRSARRNANQPSFRAISYGFRLALVPFGENSDQTSE